MNFRRKVFSALIGSICIAGVSFAPETANSKEGETLDRIVAVVENNIVLQSDIDAQVEEVAYFEDASEEALKCRVISEEIQQQLLLTGAREEDMEIDEEQVDRELDRRMNHFAMQVGGRQELEEYYGQSMQELKEDFREPMRKQMLTQQMRQMILQEVEISPREVREYFESIPEDSLPYYDTEVEIAQVVIRPEITEKERERARERALDIRERLVTDGDDFGTLAILYSDDNQTARNGGDLGFLERENLDPEYAAAAFQLEPNQVSGIVESEFGFHIIQKIERRGERINTRHILIQPSITAEAEQRARNLSDSIRTAVLNDTITFQEAVMDYSDDEDSRGSGGLILDPETGNSRISVDRLPSQMFFAIDTLQEGEISSIVEFRSPEGGREFRMFKLMEKVPPHQANLQQDYSRIREKALEEKRNDELEKWLSRKAERTFIKIDDAFHHCGEIEHFIQQSP